FPPRTVSDTSLRVIVSCSGSGTPSPPTTIWTKRHSFPTLWRVSSAVDCAETGRTATAKPVRRIQAKGVLCLLAKLIIPLLDARSGRLVTELLWFSSANFRGQTDFVWTLGCWR